MSPALNPSPPSPDSEVAAPSLIIKRTSLTVIRALPPPPRSDIAPIGIIPCTPKTSKPRTKFHPTSPIVGLAECFALPVANVEVCRVPPAAYSRAVGALRRAILYRGRMVTRAASPCSKLIGSGSVQGPPLPTLHSRGKLTGITSSRPTSAVQRRVTHPPASRYITCPTNFTVGDLSPFPRGASTPRVQRMAQQAPKGPETRTSLTHLWYPRT
jgi:hypothetical protein